MKVVFDTNILVDHLRKIKEANEIVFKLEKREIEGYISSITEAELLAGSECENEEKRNVVISLISTFYKIDVISEIARKAGEFKRKYKLPLDDCIIGATAFHVKCRLWTKNKRDFEKIKEIETEMPY